jgi:AmmeMemoRadiSam system protein B/AmmeMemoRadiSam system protein A
MPDFEELSIKTPPREPVVAGIFYPAEAQELTDLVDELLMAAEAREGDPPLAEAGARPRLVVAPHAAYRYSGPITALAFKTLMGRGYRRAVLIGRSHHALFDGVAAAPEAAWRTPLGVIEVDRDFLGRLGERGNWLHHSRAPHDSEHSLESLVPFVQRTLGAAATIVPLLLGGDDELTEAALSEALADLMDDATVVIVSADLSHYPRQADAERLDTRTVRGVMTGDVAAFRAAISEVMAEGAAGEETATCGAAAIAVGMRVADRLGLTARMLGYATSGDAPGGDKKRVVGYAALAFLGPAAILVPVGHGELEAAEQQAALLIAHETLQAAFRGGRYEPQTDLPGLLRPSGVFVTLRKDGALRGCIGAVSTSRPLAEGIRDMTLAAAFSDERFEPLAAGELADASVELTVLSPLVRIADPRLIEVGKHGVMVERGKQSGVFLPQVAVEAGYDRRQLLRQLCVQKAGLPADCWQDPETKICVFTAQVIREGL